MATPKDLPRDVGEFIRDLRRNARISLRQLAEQAGVSNPYLSQIERGLRKPSAEVLQQLASALRVSTPAMYLRAGLLDDREGQGVLAAIAVDSDLTMAQKQSLSQIYETFRRENLRHAEQSSASTEAAAGGEPPVTAGSAPLVTDLPASAPLVTDLPATSGNPAIEVLEAVAVTEAGAAPPPGEPDTPHPAKRTSRRVIRKAADDRAATRTPTADEAIENRITENKAADAVEEEK